MRVYNQKIEEALTLLHDKKIHEASLHLSALLNSEDKDLADYIEAILTENARFKSETRESLKTLMSTVTWRVRQGYTQPH